MAGRSAPSSKLARACNHDSVSAGLDASSIFADWDNGNSGEQARVFGNSENPFCVLLGLFLTYKSLGGTRNEFGGYEIDPVISHGIFLINVGEMVRFDEISAHRQVLGKAVHR